MYYYGSTESKGEHGVWEGLNNIMTVRVRFMFFFCGEVRQEYKCQNFKTLNSKISSDCCFCKLENIFLIFSKRFVN